MKVCGIEEQGRTSPLTGHRATRRVIRNTVGLLAVSALAWTMPAPAAAAAAPPTAVPAVVGPTTSGPCVGITLTEQNVKDAKARDDLQKLVNSSTGATFCLKAGLYRNWSIFPRAGQKFIGEPGVVLNGAKPLTGFTADAGAWKIGGQTQPPGQAWRDGGCLPDRPACYLPEELFINDVRQTRVLSRAEVTKGTWFFDYGADIIYVGDNPTLPGTIVETSVEPYAFKSEKNNLAPNVTIANLVVEKYATPGHMSTIGQQHLSPGWTVQHTEVRLNHGGGIAVSGGRALNNYVHHNGHQGISGSGDHTLIEGNEISYNNEAGHSYSNEGGAGKFSETFKLVYRNNHVHHNYGTGPWTDINNRETLYENNVVEYNHGPGIMHEISHAAVIRNNILRENDLKNIAPDNGNIVISSSDNVKIVGNTIVVGPQSGELKVAPEARNGIFILQANRTESYCGGVCRSDNITVENNTIQYLDRLRYLGSGAGYSLTGVMMRSAEAAMPVGIVFRNNVYTMPNCAEDRWAWVALKPDGTGFTGHRGPFTAWQRAGYDTTGSCRSVG